MFFLFRLVRVLRHLNPDVFHGYLDLPNILVYLTRKFLMKTITIWGIRGSKKNLNEYDWMARLMATLESFLCHFPDVILVNSKAGFKHAVKRGFPENKMVVIPNGINLEVFRPDREAGKKIRAEWGIRENQILIGLVGRLHPEKDHRTFLKAASLFVKDIKNTRFVCVGNGPESYKSGLMNFAKQIGVSDYLLWIDPRPDMSSVYNALTINTSSSITEGFSNVIAEAMACGVPCVVTDVGDSAWIVGETG
ncbi:MAG: glycosyltransferase, partial [Nitrospinales bacterium]